MAMAKPFKLADVDSEEALVDCAQHNASLVVDVAKELRAYLTKENIPRPFTQNMCFWEVNGKRCQIQHVQCVMTSIRYGRKKCPKSGQKNTPVLQSMTSTRCTHA